MLADLCYKGAVDDRSARIALSLGYGVLAVSGIREPVEVGRLKIVPRYEVRRGEVGEYRSTRGVRVLVVESKDDLKFYPKLVGVVTSVKIDFSNLGDVTKDFMRRLLGLGAPIELEFTDMIRRIIEGSSVDYYLLLLRLYARGKVKVYMCSGAREPSDLPHPRSMSAILSVLGVPEPLALKAVLKLPAEMVSDVT